MEKNYLSYMKSAATVAFVSLFMVTYPIVAQDVPSMNASDYTIPAWTQFRKALNELESAQQPYSINMTVNGDPSSRIAFAWFTNQNITEGKVQIIKKADATEVDFVTPTSTINATSEKVENLNYLNSSKNAEVIQATGIVANTKMTYTSHKAVADNLLPGTTYSYRLGKDGAWSEIGHFTTAQTQYDVNQGYSFIYITDTQANTQEMFDISQKTVHAAQEKVPNAQFVLCNGDFVETSGTTNSEWEWEQWFKTMQDIWMNYPLVVAQGNHDTSSNNNFAWHFNTDRSFNQTSAIKTTMDGSVYSFVYGNALFMVINYEDYSKEGYFDALANWMTEQVSAHPNVKWRIATYHKNMFTGSNSHQSDSDGKLVRAAMLPVFDRLKIDVALQGHDHIYEVLGPVKNSTKTLVDGAVEHVQTVGEPGARENMTGKQGGVFNVNEGTLYFLNNSAGKKKYEPRDENKMISELSKHEVDNYWGLFSGKFGQTGEATFSDVKLTADTIFISTYTVDNSGEATLFDSFKVIKENKTVGTQTAKAENQVKIYNDNEQKKIIIEGIEPELVEIYTDNGQLIAKESSKIISTSEMIKGLYIVKASLKKDSYYGKVVIK